jgi:hypothetical protein
MHSAVNGREVPACGGEMLRRFEHMLDLNRPSQPALPTSHGILMDTDVFFADRGKIFRTSTGPGTVFASAEL